jgi:glutamate-1-semialdehyde 2,1-aminomutase
MTRAPSSSTEAMRQLAHQLIPGGCHTYAKGDDQFPEAAPAFIARGLGCHVWDLDGREFIEYGMGLRSVTLGHAFPAVVQAAASELAHGTNFSRPTPLELECAETFLRILPTARMVKFCKDGSHAIDGAIRLARAHTGRDMVAICADHPFFSTSDWFIGTTEMPAGVPQAIRRQVVKFPYNDLAALEALFREYPGQLSCVVMEATRVEEPGPGYLSGVLDLAHKHGALLVFDEMITGFRRHLAGAQGLYGVTPDLSAFGKALANGFAVSALAGRRDLMELGGIGHDRERVFLLSTTHGAETHALAAAIATMRFYESHPVIETLHARGARLRAGCEHVIAAQGLTEYVAILGPDCNLLFATRDGEKRPSQPFRALFMQEMIKRGVLAPSFVVSYSHTEDDIDRTVEAVAASLVTYRKALEDDSVNYLEGRPVKPVFRPYA